MDIVVSSAVVGDVQDSSIEKFEMDIVAVKNIYIESNDISNGE